MMRVYQVPSGTVLVGTCGACGGPVLSPQILGSSNTNELPPAQCANCGRMAKPTINPQYGPLQEMQ